MTFSDHTHAASSDTMASHKKHFFTGSIDDEIAHVQMEIRSKPAAFDLRVYFFQLLCLTGQWQRAVTQLQVCAQLDAKAIPMAQTYREALRCELIRADVFAGKKAPQVIGQPPQWLGSLIEAQQKLGAGAVAEAATLRQQALQDAPETEGTIDGAPFAWISDADSRLGPVVEAIVNGQYYWIPFSQFHAIRIEAPTDLRDLVWIPAQFTFTNQGQTVALIPARYAGSETQDDASRLSRKTDWIALDEQTYTGIGQRMLATDCAEYALLDVRDILISSSSHHAT